VHRHHARSLEAIGALAAGRQNRFSAIDRMPLAYEARLAKVVALAARQLRTGQRCELLDCL
jgi:hypothetical protein